MRSFKSTFYPFVLPLLAVVSSCELIDPEEPIPAYIEVEDIKVETDYATEGTASHNIFDLWFIHNGKIQATVPYPCTVPILQDGTSEVEVYPGIKENGTSTNRSIYPFLEPVKLNLDFTGGKVSTYNGEEMVFKYKDNIKFLWLEDFESETISIQPMVPGGTIYERTKAESKVLEGNASLRITMNQENDVMVIQSFDNFAGSEFGLGSPTYLEMNYRNELPIQVGYQYTSIDNLIQYDDPFLYLRASVNEETDEAEWRKIYIKMTEDVAVLQSGASIKLYFASILPDDVEEAEILFDNFKLLTFE